jgi:protein-L-isoaspartate(D-aspartate) O-methyltransferase
VELHSRLAAEAAPRLARAGIRNVKLATGDAARGWGKGRYDAIVFTGSMPEFDAALLAQLKPDGRLFAIVGEAPVMTARIVRWVGPDSFTTSDQFETVVGPLRNVAVPARFTF